MSSDKNKVQMKANFFKDMTVKFGRDTEFKDAFTLSKDWVPPPPAHEHGMRGGDHYSFSFSINKLSGQLTVRETWKGDVLGVIIEIPREDYVFVRADSLDREGNETENFVILVTLKEGRHFHIRTEIPGPPNNQRRGQLEVGMRLWLERNSIRTHHRCLEVRIPDFRRTNIAGKFDANVVFETLSAARFENTKTEPHSYNRAQPETIFSAQGPSRPVGIPTPAICQPQLPQQQQDAASAAAQKSAQANERPVDQFRRLRREVENAAGKDEKKLAAVRDLFQKMMKARRANDENAYKEAIASVRNSMPANVIDNLGTMSAIPGNGFQAIKAKFDAFDKEKRDQLSGFYTRLLQAQNTGNATAYNEAEAEAARALPAHIHTMLINMIKIAPNSEFDLWDL